MPVLGAEMKCRLNKKYAEVRAEYGEWLKDYEVATILRIKRENAVCERCKGLPCEKSGNQHSQGRFTIDEETRTLEVSYTAACKYWRNARMKSRFKNCRIPDRYIGKTFSDYEVTAQNKAAVAWAKYAIKNPQEGLLLYGVPGSGKTFLVSIVAQELIRQGKRLIFGDVPTLLDELRGSFGKEGAGCEELMRELESADVLILDDIGAEYGTEWALERLYLIINNRYNAGKALIVTSNYGAEEMIKRFKSAVVGKRIVSRLSEMCHAVELRGNDRRLMKEEMK